MKNYLFVLFIGFITFSNSMDLFFQDFPASSLEKEGYRLIFHDEFSSDQIDTFLWIPEYLPSWPDERSKSQTSYSMQDGIMKLYIDKQSPNEFSEGMYISGFMSGSRTGMHRYSEKLKAKHPIYTKATQINQYGYYEMRAKMNTGGGVHCAWWLIGFEDDPDESCEIDIFEILGTDVDRIWSTVHPWKDSTITYHTECPWFANKRLADEFHVYGFEWTPDSVFVTVDGILTMSHSVSIAYPLIQIISLYDNRKAKNAWTGTYDPSIPYPKCFEIDYLRLYKKIPAGFAPVNNDQLEIVSIEPAYLTLKSNKVAYRDIDGHRTAEILYTPTYVHVHYNDGTVTQQFVEWEPITNETFSRIKESGVVIIDGVIKGLPDSILKNRKATLVIKTVK